MTSFANSPKRIFSAACILLERSPASQLAATTAARTDLCSKRARHITAQLVARTLPHGLPQGLTPD
jgi:hypothetical protein